MTLENGWQVERYWKPSIKLTKTEECYKGEEMDSHGKDRNTLLLSTSGKLNCLNKKFVMFIKFFSFNYTFCFIYFVYHLLHMMWGARLLSVLLPAIVSDCACFVSYFCETHEINISEQIKTCVSLVFTRT